MYYTVGRSAGEAPAWNPEEKKLSWVDILHSAVYRVDPETGVNEICEPGKPVSAALPRAGGGVVIATPEGFHLVWVGTGCCLKATINGKQ